MEYDASKVGNLIQKYITGCISRQELGAWALSAYEDLLKGGYLALKKLAVYPFLKSLSSLRIEVDEIADQYPATKEDVERIGEILCGVRDAGFSVEIAPSNRFFQTPLEQYTKINKLYEAVLRLQDGERLACDTSFAQNVHDTFIRSEPNTIYDLIESTIVELFDASFDIQDGSFQRKEPLRLYAPTSQESVPFKRLMQSLTSFRNNNNFCFLIYFNKGTPMISLIL